MSLTNLPAQNQAVRRFKQLLRDQAVDSLVDAVAPSGRPVFQGKAVEFAVAAI